MNELMIISGMAEDLERSTEVQGTSQRTSTTHLSMFVVDGQRVLLRTATPSVISNGDQVELAGTLSNGQFHALACKNLTANWISPLRQQKVAFAVLICMAVVSFLSFFLVLPIIFGGVCIFFAIKLKKHDDRLKQAHQMIVNH
ncbi:MAG: hypothetical protein CML13_09005 [Puniceicoccaceae bacterium]|nr:hypothetical protein [Puniceicoccaceae bacterium]